MGATWRMMIAAGGTGGHIMPALAIGEHLGRVEPDCAIRYVCGARPVELEIYRRAGIEPKVIAVDQLGHGPFGFLASIFKLRRSIAAARAYLREERPAAALGMGGYVCFPAMSAAVGEKVPTLIHESNALAGRANRWLARRVTAVACGYAEAATAFPAAKTRVTGNPVRPEFIGGNRAEALRRWQFREGAPTLLVFGGSQGARRLNQLVLDSLPALDARAESFGGLQLLWSCGERNFVLMEELVRRLALRRTNLTLVPFIREMGLAYAAADLALGRAGAMTVAELTANALPAILVPLPGAVGGHQALNAKPVAEAGAGIVLDESALDGASLARTVGDLFSDRPRLNQMRAAARQIGRPRAVEEIVEMIFGLRGKLP